MESINILTINGQKIMAVETSNSSSKIHWSLYIKYPMFCLFTGAKSNNLVKINVTLQEIPNFKFKIKIYLCYHE